MAKPLVLTRNGKTIGPRGKGDQVDQVADPFTLELTKTGLLVRAAKPALLWVTERYDCEFRFDSCTFEQVDAGRSGSKMAIGAIAGTLIAGPLGLLAGAAMGGGKSHMVLAHAATGTLLAELTSSEFQVLVGRGVLLAAS